MLPQSNKFKALQFLSTFVLRFWSIGWTLKQVFFRPLQCVWFKRNEVVDQRIMYFSRSKKYWLLEYFFTYKKDKMFLYLSLSQFLSLCGAFIWFRQAKFAYGGSILCSSSFLLVPKLPQKMKLPSKVVKIDSCNDAKQIYNINVYIESQA